MINMKIFTDLNDLSFSSEIIFLYGLLPSSFQEPRHCYNSAGISRYKGLQSFCEKILRM